jgi:SAM-dependent methyltransferase
MNQKPKKEIQTFETSDDGMWKTEVEKLFPWLFGKGVDIGCGMRSAIQGITRVDIDPAVSPDFVSSGDSLPFKDGEFDYLISVHSFEHFEDQKKTLKEWLRVINTGGVIGIVHPDITYTQKQKPANRNIDLKINPNNYHYHEQTPESLKKQLLEWSDLPFIIVDQGVACGNWSFYTILRKT